MNRPITETLRIENIGQVVVQFRFIPKLQEQMFCKEVIFIFIFNIYNL